jgi:ribosomal protein S18 acetylase RimI-like enzyme
MTRVRRAQPADADVIGQLLHDVHSEFDEPTPGPQALAERVRKLLADGDIIALLAGGGPDGLAVLRLTGSLWKDALQCYLEELYVAPDRRGRGIGRALMDAAIDLARREGAADMHLATGEDDTAARALYESLGFSNRDSDGALNFFYEREL